MSASPVMEHRQAGTSEKLKTDQAGERWRFPYPGSAFPALHAGLHANMLNTWDIESQLLKKAEITDI